MKRTLAVCVLVCLSAVRAFDMEDDKEYTNKWVTEIHGGEEVAKRVARELGYTYGGQADPFENHYILTRDDHPEVSKRNSHHLTKNLEDIEEVKWAEQMAVVKRSKRGIIPETPMVARTKKMSTEQELWSILNNLSGQKTGSSSSYFSNSGQSSSSQYSYKPSNQQSYKPSSNMYSSSSSSSSNSQTQSNLSKLGSFTTKPSSSSLRTYQGVTKHVECLSSKRSAYENLFNDPLWQKQWYMQDYRTNDMPVMDINVVPVYKMGYTGKSVYVGVVDDGLIHNHPDLVGNFVESLSYDMSNDIPGSTPDVSPDHTFSHGTKCAGEIAMVANNNKCGVGVAYNCKVAGIKVLGTRSVEYNEARGLVHRLDIFDIYTNSWGPEDNGKFMEKLGRMSTLSLEKGVTQGRKGNGAIYVFAGGNGKHNGDTCAADGLVNSPYTIPIASVSQKGKTVYYSERCSAIFAAAYSGGNGYDEKVVTIDLNNGCTSSFSGTSAAAPLATGIITLALDANNKLTYRDVMHLITMSAEVAPLADNGDIWYKNGKGFWVSNDFGFGLLNAENMVTLAKTWKNVPKKNTCIISVKLDEPQYLTVGEVASIQFVTEACQDTSKDAVVYLEQIELASTVQYPYRGALSMTIKSPAGTKTTLLETRPLDSNKDGLRDWSIKSLHNWGENPKGTWVIEVSANPLTGVQTASGYVLEFTLTLHGTAQKPAHHANIPRKYSGFRLPNGKTSEV